MADDFLQKKKDTAPILDLSKAVINTKEDFKKLFDRVPDFKIRPVKVRQDEIKIREKHKDFRFKTGKKELKALKEPYRFQDPVPPEMVGIKLEDFFPVPIDWRMLTTLRPKNKVDEDYFSRLVELGKSQLKTQNQDKRLYITNPVIRKTKNKSGVVETRAVACIECGEEFCDGISCSSFVYDSFSRVPVVEKAKKPVLPNAIIKKEKKKKVVQQRSRSKSKSNQASKSKTRQRSKSKSKSPVKTPSKKSAKSTTKKKSK